jgi:hypothetical protein
MLWFAKYHGIGKKCQNRIPAAMVQIKNIALISVVWIRIRIGNADPDSGA